MESIGCKNQSIGELNSQTLSDKAFRLCDSAFFSGELTMLKNSQNQWNSLALRDKVLRLYAFDMKGLLDPSDTGC